MKKEPGKMFAITVQDCEKHGTHVTDVDVEDIDISVDDQGNHHLFNKSGEPIGYSSSVSVGYSPKYASNWEANFGQRDTKPEDLN